MITPEERRRRHVVHGWAFRDFSQDAIKAILHYLATGEMLEAFPSNYRKLHNSSRF